MNLKECRKRREQLDELFDMLADPQTIISEERDYYREVLVEVYDATVKNGGSWTNSLAGIALSIIKK